MRGVVPVSRVPACRRVSVWVGRRRDARQTERGERDARDRPAFCRCRCHAAVHAVAGCSVASRCDGNDHQAGRRPGLDTPNQQYGPHLGRRKVAGLCDPIGVALRNSPQDLRACWSRSSRPTHDRVVAAHRTDSRRAADALAARSDRCAARSRGRAYQTIRLSRQPDAGRRRSVVVLSPGSVVVVPAHSR